MASFLVVSGWFLNALAVVWIGLILLKIIFGWFSPAGARSSGGLAQVFSAVVTAPVNWVRRTVPTVYRKVDFAPWLTILFLILIKTFIFRAMIYWGMLHRPLL